jgi:hypothetical protein
MGDVKLQGGGVLIEGAFQVAHLVVALADHCVVADRVDPAAFGAGDARAGGVAELAAGFGEVAIVEVAEGVEIAVVWSRLGPALPGDGLGMSGLCSKQQGGRNGDE